MMQNQPAIAGHSQIAVGSYRSRPTIAFLAAVLGPDLYLQKWQIWSGIERVCREQGVNLLYVAGGSARQSPESLLYDLISAHNVDGIISWTGTVFPNTGQEQAVAFLKQYAPLPVVNVGWFLPGIPSVIFDQAKGVEDLLVHLIEVHHKSRIAYLLSSTNNATRASSYNGYEDTMRRYGIFQPELVFDQTVVLPGGEFQPASLEKLLDCQAAVCSVDTDAINLLRILEQHNIHVPDDIAVTGIHGSQEARVAVPPLTTARIPFFKGGKRAAELLLQRMNGQVIAEYSTMPLELIIRESCGCTDRQVAFMPAPYSGREKQTFLQAAAAERERILAHLENLFRFTEDLGQDWAARLFDAFVLNLSPGGGIRIPGQSSFPQAFTSELGKILRSTQGTGMDLYSWQNVISVLRKSFSPIIDPQQRDFAEDLWQQAAILVGQVSARNEARRFLSLAEQSRILSEIETSFHLAQDVGMLGSILLTHLPSLGISDCYISLYEDPARPLEQSKLILAIGESGRIDLPAEGMRFPTGQLIPPGLDKQRSPTNRAVESLRYLDEHFGFVLFGSQPGRIFEMVMTYETLRRQISSAIKGIWLLQQIKESHQKAEEANHLKSQFLSMVSHELRTPLNLIVSLCEMAGWKQTLAGASMNLPAAQEIDNTLSQIHASAQHLDWLIRDVLDLASSQVGQLQLTCDAIDLREVLRSTGVMGEKLAEHKRLEWITRIPETMPLVLADGARIRQVILNLISNAVKFTAHGEVELGATYDSQEVMVYVRDTGIGVPLEEQSAIFDEFRQSERTSSRGYGGTGLGLAVTKKLVEMHGGRVNVRSPGSEDGGSTFYFTLPVYAEKEAPRATALERQGSNIILLCHKGENNYQLMKDLISQGFMLATWFFEDGDGWFDFIIEQQPLAVIVDCIPEKEEGWTVLKLLKEHPETMQIPVLFYALMQEQDLGVVLDMDLLNKPLQKNALLRIFQQYRLKESPAPSTRSILVADDDPGTLVLHAQVIADLLPGYEILQARDGHQALDLIQAHLPDLVLLDLMMPEMNGFAVLEAMQANSATSEIPVVVITGQTLTEWEMNQFSQRVNAILAKGMFTVAETREHIRAALGRNRRLGNEAQRLVRIAMAYIHTHYRETINRTDIARHLGIDEDYLTRCFKREVGLSPITYLNRYRIQQARLLLETGMYNILQVALEVGFTSQSYFTRMFQREVGIAPKAYMSGQREP